MKKKALLLIGSTAVVGGVLAISCAWNNPFKVGESNVKAGDTLYTCALTAANAPESYGSGKEILVNSTRETLMYMNYSGASAKENYHATFTEGGYLENYEMLKGLKQVNITCTGSFVFTYGQSADDLYVSVEYDATTDQLIPYTLEVPANYFKLEVTSATADVKNIEFSYSCEAETAKNMVTVHHKSVTDGSRLGRDEHFFFEKTANKVTFEPKEVKDMVKDRDVISAHIDGHTEFTVYHSELVTWSSEGASEITDLEGEGTEANPYLIKSSNDWNFLRNNALVGDADHNLSGLHFKMRVSLDFQNQDGSVGLVKADASDNTFWFSGTLDGNHCSIRNALVNSKSNYIGAAFRALGVGSLMKNLSTYGSVTGAWSTGGIVGRCWGSLENCYNYCSINSTIRQVGGIVGWISTSGLHISGCQNYGTVYTTAYGADGSAGIVGRLNSSGIPVTNCDNFGDVTGSTQTGGIVGVGYENSLISYCNNFGDITNVSTETTTAAATYVGGLAGYLTSSIEHSNNFGNVTGGRTCIGGLIGYGGNASSHISFSNNYGEIKNTYTTTELNGMVGGLVGRSYYTSMSDCSNFGLVDAGLSGRDGGIVGIQSAVATFTRMANHGKVTSDRPSSGWDVWQGGIVGSCSADSTFISCLNTGEIAGQGAMGGIIGCLEGGKHATITDCTNSGFINGLSAQNGGIIGRLHSAASYVTINSATNTGDIKGSKELGGIVGYIYNDGYSLCSISYANCSSTGSFITSGTYGTLTGGQTVRNLEDF